MMTQAFLLVFWVVGAVNGQLVGCPGCQTGLQQQQGVVQQQGIQCQQGMACQTGTVTGYQTGTVTGYQSPQQTGQRLRPGQQCGSGSVCPGGTICQGTCTCITGYTQTLTDCIPGPNAARPGGTTYQQQQGYQTGVQQQGYGYQQLYPQVSSQMMIGGYQSGQPCGYQGQGCNTGYQTYRPQQQVVYPQQQQMVYPQQQQMIYPQQQQMVYPQQQQMVYPQQQMVYPQQQQVYPQMIPQQQVYPQIMISGQTGYQMGNQPCGYQGTGGSGGCATNVQQQFIPAGYQCQNMVQSQQQCITGTTCVNGICQCTAAAQGTGACVMGKKLRLKRFVFRHGSRKN